jgi:hypothetical protein
MFLKFTHGPYKSLIFIITLDDTNTHTKQLEFSHFHHKVVVTYQLFSEWVPITC